jgi:hypothetical protein
MWGISVLAEEGLSSIRFCSMRTLLLLLLLLLLLVLFILTANGFVPGGSGTTIRHNIQNCKNNKGHILHTIHTITIQIQLQYTYKYIS